MFSHSVNSLWQVNIIANHTMSVTGVSQASTRHTYVSLMLKQGVHPKIVQERLGNASIQITLDTYSHVTPELQEATAGSFEKLMSPSYNGLVENEAVENHY